VSDASDQRPRSVGRSVPRSEDLRLLRGEGRYVADLAGGGALHVAFLRSQVPAVEVRRVDVEAARRAPGVVDVLTGEDLAKLAGPLPVLHVPNDEFAAATHFRMSPPPVRGLAVRTSTYVGEPLVAVVASSRALAEDAVDLIRVEVEELEPVVDARAALADGARQLYTTTPGNLAASVRFARGTVPVEGITVEATYRMGRHTGVPLETRGVVAEFDPRRGRVEMWTSSQIPLLVHSAICRAARWDHDQLRVAVPDVGGGFGPKANIYPEELVVAVLARRLKARVAWIEDRLEHMVSAAHSRDQVIDARLVVDRGGLIRGYEATFVVDVGASNLWVAGVVANSAIHAPGPYRVPAFDIRGWAAVTNKTPTSQYRGAGRPEACFALERSLDAAARRLGLDPVEIRRRNVLRRDDLPYEVGLPYRDGVPIVYDGGDYGATLEAAAAMVSSDEIAAARGSAEAGGRRLGVGVAMFIEATGRGPFETARVRLTPTGRIMVHTGAASAGQGHETTLAQVAADALRRSHDDVTVIEGDTELVPDGMGSFASRTAVVAGSAVHVAAVELCRRARDRAGELLGVAVDDVELGDAGFRARGTDVTWDDLAREHARGGQLEGLEPLDVTMRFQPPTVTWTAGTHVAVVEVDPELGDVRVIRYGVVDEGGIAIHPRIVEGQVKGGVAQGLGGALLEELTFDGGGQPTATTFAEYLLPSSADVPTIDVQHLTVPSAGNPIGVRGVGESGTIPVYATIAAAVDDALGAGVHVAATPITSDRVLELLGVEESP
jgi:carbon-monoxide dehydrogenase large subunit